MIGRAMYCTVRRRRGLIFKLIVAAFVLWFSAIAFSVVMLDTDYYGNADVQNMRDDSVHRFDRDTYKRTTKSSVGNYAPGNHTMGNTGADPQEGDAEPPYNDRSRLMQRMAEEAELRLRDKEADRHKELGKKADMDAMQRPPLNPFHDHIIQEKVNRSEAVPHVQHDPNAPGT